MSALVGGGIVAALDVADRARAAKASGNLAMAAILYRRAAKLTELVDANHRYTVAAFGIELQLTRWACEVSP